MFYIVKRDGLTHTTTDTYMSWELLKELTGKDLSTFGLTRRDEKILLSRIQGKAKFFDMKLKKGFTYRRIKDKLECVCMNIHKSGNATMGPVGDKLKLIIASEPTEWEIVI